MKTLALVLISIFLFSSMSFAKTVYVDGYVKSNGTYVMPHTRTSPDSTIYNNKSYLEK